MKVTLFKPFPDSMSNKSPEIFYRVLYHYLDSHDVITSAKKSTLSEASDTAYEISKRKDRYVLGIVKFEDE